MLRILDEKFLFENTKIGQSFRPENFAFILVYEGSITLEVNGIGLCFQKGNVIIISPFLSIVKLPPNEISGATSFSFAA